MVTAAGGVGVAMLAPWALSAPAAAAEAAAGVATFAAIAEVVAKDPLRPIEAAAVSRAVAAFGAEYAAASSADRTALDYILSRVEAVAGGPLRGLGAERRRAALIAGLGRTRLLETMSEGLHVSRAVDLVAARLRPEYRPGRDPLPLLFREAGHA